MESARTATFALEQLAFPRGSVDWAVLKEACEGPHKRKESARNDKALHLHLQSSHFRLGFLRLGRHPLSRKAVVVGKLP